MKRSINQEDITRINVCEPNKEYQSIWNKIERIQGEIDNSEIIIAYHNTPLYFLNWIEFKLNLI